MKLTPLGQRRTTVTIQRLKSGLTQDAAGHIDQSVSTNWETYLRLKMKVEYGGGTETLVGDELQSANSWLLTGPSSTKSREIDTKMRAIFNGHTCGISEPPVDVEQMNREIQIRCIEVSR